MRDFSFDALVISLGLFLRKVRSYFLPKSPWEKIETYPPNAVSPEAKQPEKVTTPPAQIVTDKSEKGVWEDCSYCWVVLCKNHRFHRKGNLSYVHRIPLGQTDAFATVPAIGQPFRARCDECRKEYIFEAKEVLRWEMEVPSTFVPHPLFRE